MANQQYNLLGWNPTIKYLDLINNGEVIVIPFPVVVNKSSHSKKKWILVDVPTTYKFSSGDEETTPDFPLQWFTFEPIS